MEPWDTPERSGNSLALKPFISTNIYLPLTLEILRYKTKKRTMYAIIGLKFFKIMSWFTESIALVKSK